MLISRLTGAILLIPVAGPVLLSPDPLPRNGQTTTVTWAPLASLILALLLSRWKRPTSGLSLFAFAVVGSWATTPTHDALSLRHFGGIGVGVLAMAIVATWCVTTNRLITATVLFAFAAAGALIASLFTTLIFPWKFVGGVRLIPEIVYFWLPRWRLGLPGLPEDGHVNPNALGGMAVLLLPTCIGLAAAAAIDVRRHWLPLLAGMLSTTVGLVVLGITLSRTAFFSALLTLVLLGLRWRRARRWVLLALLLSFAGLAYQAGRSHTLAPQAFETGASAVLRSVLTRVDIWRDGVERLRKHPWLGIGINQFHDVTPTATNDGLLRVPHAHNTLLQVALDIGLLGLCGYLLLIGTLLRDADRAARSRGIAGRIAAGAGWSLVSVHLFGLGDAIALGAKVGLFQWLCAGLIVAASQVPRSEETSRTQPSRTAIKTG